jgi:DNA-binding NtrC family response regulator
MLRKNLNIFILNNDHRTAVKLRAYLKRRFGTLLNISLFLNSHKCLATLQSGVDMVVIDDYNYERDPKGVFGLEILKRIKQKNSLTEVIILTSSADISLAVEAMQTGARDYIFNKRGAWERLQNDIKKLFAAPAHYISELGVTVFISVYFAVFITLALTAYVAASAGN